MVSTIKEKYYSAQSIDTQAEKFMNTVDFLLEERNWELSKTRCALIVLDMQKYFIDENSHAFIPSGETIVARIKKIQDTFFNLDLPVIHTRHTNTQQDAGQLAHWWRDILTAGNPLSAIIDDIADERAIVIDKTQYDAFHDTGLEIMLKQKNIQQVLIAGVMTHLCCETTARSAFIRGFETFLVVDGTATYNREFHRATLLNLAHGFAVPILANEIK